MNHELSESNGGCAGYEDSLRDARLRWCVTLIDGSASYGPAPSEQMRCWLREGRIPADAYVWREGWSQWRRASLVFPNLLSGAPADDNHSLSEAPQAAAERSNVPARSSTVPAETRPKPARDARWSDVPLQTPRRKIDWVYWAAVVALGLAFASLAATAFLAFRA